MTDADHGLLADWERAFSLGERIVGGKGWNLARLRRYGLPVPDGLVLIAPAYEQFIEANGLRDLAATCVNLPLATNGKLPEQVTLLREGILAASMPPTLEEEIAQSIAAAGFAQLPMAVRSSATGEDSVTASFAGIFESFLNVRGSAELMAAIRGCFASLWSERAVTYRRRLAIDDLDVAPAVVIMPLVEARAAGVAFSCDPVNGREDTMLIAANFGLGESVVAGTANPDSYEVRINPDNQSPEVTGTSIGDKRSITAMVEGGTAEVVNPVAGERVLDDSRIVELAGLVRRVFLALGNGDCHQDMEWVLDMDGRFHIVQARPVTSRPTYTYPALAAQPLYWSNANYRDVVPMVQTPLNWSISTHMVNHIFHTQYLAGGYRIDRGVVRSRLFNGRAYFNLSQLQWECYDAYGIPPAQYNRLIGGHQPEIRVPDPEPASLRLKRLWHTLTIFRSIAKAKQRSANMYRDLTGNIDALRRLDLAPLSEARLAGILAEAERLFKQYDEIHLLLSTGGAVFVTLVPLLERFAPGRGMALAGALLAGQEGITSADHGTELAELAQIAAEEPECRAFFATEPFAPADWSRLPATSEFIGKFKAFLAEYGHRSVYELDYCTPRWYEDPSYLLETIRAMIGTTSPEAIRGRQRQAAEAAWAEVGSLVPRWLLPVVRRMVRGGGRDAANREMAKSVLVRMGDITRRTVLEIARRLVSRGWLTTENDIFFLHRQELATLLDRSIGPTGLAELIADRREEHRRNELIEPQDVIVQEGQHVFTSQVSPSGGSTAGMKGIGVAPGRVSGIARIIRHPDEGGRLSTGEILVAPSTDPAWTPLFLKAAALVTETGGIISHGAIVAREYGIPAVLNVRGALELIRDGQRIVVDGDHGVVGD